VCALKSKMALKLVHVFKEKGFLGRWIRQNPLDLEKHRNARIIEGPASNPACGNA